MKCKACGSHSEHFSNAVLLKKFDVKYYRCGNCGFVQTEEPHWLSAAYSSAISGLDAGLLSRNLFLSKVTKAVIDLFFDKHGRFLDYGGGYGIFVRMMRDKGFDFYRYDKYCQNLFAKYFDIGLDSLMSCELVTAFEVFEHFENPSDDIKDLLRHSSNILFSTELFPASLPKPGKWGYYGLDHGQHISFYTKKSLEEIAQRHGLNLVTDGQSVHMFTKKRLPNVLFGLVCHGAVASVFDIIIRGRSLIDKDLKLIYGNDDSIDSQ
jgi:hypothetical protein